MAAPVVSDGDGPIGIERNIDLFAIAGQSLVNGVINDLVYQVNGALGDQYSRYTFPGRFTNRFKTFRVPESAQAP